LLVYGPLRNVLGMSRIRVAYTAGARSDRSLPLLSFDRRQPEQLYGSTETALTSACSRRRR
jgi:long-subunit acyl-CoA synthetase (AMP-forming)